MSSVADLPADIKKVASDVIGMFLWIRQITVESSWEKIDQLGFYDIWYAESDRKYLIVKAGTELHSLSSETKQHRL